MTFLSPARLLGPLMLVALAGLVWLLVFPDPNASVRSTDLGDAVGHATRSRLSVLKGDPAACRAALDRAGVAYRAVAPRSAPDACAFDDGVAWSAGGAREALYAPAAPTLACPLAAGLSAWEWSIVQPAAFAGRVANGPEVYGAVGLVLDDGIANSIYGRCECK